MNIELQHQALQIMPLLLPLPFLLLQNCYGQSDQVASKMLVKVSELLLCHACQCGTLGSGIEPILNESFE